MAAKSTQKKNRFKDQEAVDLVVVDHDGKVVGEYRIQPSRIKWRQKNSGKWYTVTLKTFEDWITENGKKTDR